MTSRFWDAHGIIFIHYPVKKKSINSKYKIVFGVRNCIKHWDRQINEAGNNTNNKFLLQCIVLKLLLRPLFFAYA